MSSSVSSIRQVESAFVGAREGNEEFEAHSTGGVGGTAPRTGFRSKLRRFWQRTRIPSVVKKVVEGSKILLNRLNLRTSTHPPSPESTKSGKDDVSPSRVEIVKFPEYMIPSPVDSSNEEYQPTSILLPTPLVTNLGNSVHKSNPVAVPSILPIASHHDAIAVKHTSPVSRDQSLFGGFRYKEKLEKQKRFPEIKLGVVSSRVNWLEPIMSGAKAEGKKASQKEIGTRRHGNGKETDRSPLALEIHKSSGLAPMMDGGKVEHSPCSPESDEEFVFDDSPRLFKHRLPEEEPKPWVEPGTVAKGAMWLHPVLSGPKRSGSGDSGHDHLTSPTRITHGAFR